MHKKIKFLKIKKNRKNKFLKTLLYCKTFYLTNQQKYVIIYKKSFFWKNLVFKNNNILYGMAPEKINF